MGRGLALSPLVGNGSPRSGSGRGRRRGRGLI